MLSEFFWSVRCQTPDFYNMNVFNRCENGNDVLLAISGWANVHPLLKVIPVEWEHSIPYGLLHSPEPSETVRRFLSAAQEAMVSKTIKFSSNPLI